MCTCQHRWFPCGEIHVTGLPLSFYRMVSEPWVEEVKHVKRAAAAVLLIGDAALSNEILQQGLYDILGL